MELSSKTNSSSYRNLQKSQLGGIIFGCKNNTMNEYIFKQILGLPAQHFSYVKNIDPGLPLFLFNYSDRKLHGIFEVVSFVQMNINPYACTNDGSETTQYPAQVLYKFSPSTFTPQNTLEMRSIYENFEPNGKITVDPLDYPSVLSQLIQGVEELKAFKNEQIHKMSCFEEKMVQAESEIWLLKDRCTMLESLYHPSMAHFDVRVNESTAEIHLDLDDWIFLVGGYNGSSYFSSLDCYSPSHDVIKSLRPMNSVRSYPSVASLNSQLYVFGGGDGHVRYETVESYDPAKNEWKFGPSLREKKGSLAGAALNGKLFALGGGNGREYLSDVEMLDLDIGRWILTRSMRQKRFALAVAELNGALYAVGGYDGTDYLKSAERFDPREHSWTKIENMNTKRSDHSLAVMNEKLYAVGGHDGSTMVQSVEIYDPRRGWIVGDPMVEPRGYPAAVVLKNSIYALGGVKVNDQIINTVECYKEGEGWCVIETRAIGRRGFFSAFVLSKG